MGAARAGIVPDAPGIADYRAALGTLVPEWSRPGDGDAEVSPVIIGEALLRLLSLPGRPAGCWCWRTCTGLTRRRWRSSSTWPTTSRGRTVLCLVTLRDTEPSAGLDLLHSVSARRAATRVAGAAADDRAR